MKKKVHHGSNETASKHEKESAEEWKGEWCIFEVRFVVMCCLCILDCHDLIIEMWW